VGAVCMDQSRVWRGAAPNERKTPQKSHSVKLLAEGSCRRRVVIVGEVSSQNQTG